VVWQQLMGLGKDEILARVLVMIVAFIPFFAFWEANEAMGEGRLLKLLLLEREA
jgi:hypothetical protein